MGAALHNVVAFMVFSFDALQLRSPRPQRQAPFARNRFDKRSILASLSLGLLIWGADMGEPIFITHEQNRAYHQGYSDYVRTEGGSKNLSILRPAYDPPAGYDAAYRAGWNQAAADRCKGDTHIEG